MGPAVDAAGIRRFFHKVEMKSHYLWKIQILDQKINKINTFLTHNAILNFSNPRGLTTGSIKWSSMNGYRGQATVIRKFGEVENGVTYFFNKTLRLGVLVG
ncbi:MAG: hypothetical protein A3F46_04815 [Legionellales bacterium RIFCSPHIGHO2_12_FULL_42_9]|nr:MAG: hypothetical protein A3F46_04815 [Legionellales bacterium RIFCSPHIGHO2_12_FULL_42_9]